MHKQKLLSKFVHQQNGRYSLIRRDLDMILKLNKGRHLSDTYGNLFVCNGTRR